MNHSKTRKQPFIKSISTAILSEGFNSNSKKLKLYFTLLRTLSISPEIVKEIMKMRTIEEIVGAIQPQCKNEKDLKLMKHYLLYYAQFLAGFAVSEEGQKTILKLKPVFEFVLFQLDTISLPQAGASLENQQAVINLV